jgi:hypothetical protein
MLRLPDLLLLNAYNFVIIYIIFRYLEIYIQYIVCNKCRNELFYSSNLAVILTWQMKDFRWSEVPANVKKGKLYISNMRLEKRAMVLLKTFQNFKVILYVARCPWLLISTALIYPIYIYPYFISFSLITTLS